MKFIKMYPGIELGKGDLQIVGLLVGIVLDAKNAVTFNVKCSLVRRFVSEDCEKLKRIFRLP